MARKRFTPEQIVAILREAERVRPSERQSAENEDEGILARPPVRVGYVILTIL